MKIIKTATLALAATLSLASCNKKDEAQTAASSPSQAKSAEVAQGAPVLSPVRGHKMLALLPSGSIGFSLFDYTLKSSTSWLNSAWAKSQFSFSDLTKKLDENDADIKKLLTVLEGLESEGLLPSRESGSNLAQVLAFVANEVSADKSEHPAFVVIENLKDGIDGGAKLSAAKAKIAAAGVEMKENKAEGSISYSTDVVLFRPKEKSEKAVTSTVTFTAKANRLVMSSSSSLPVANYLTDSGANGAGMSELTSDPAFNKALSQVADSADEFSFSYIDTKRLLSAVSHWAPDDKMTPEELKKVPVQSIAFVRSMSDALVDSGAVTLTDEASQSAPVSKELAAVNNSSFFTQVPKGLVGLLSIDGALIKAIAKGALDATPEKERQEAQAAIAPLLGTKEFGVAVRPQKGASPLPELALLLETADAASLTKTISTLIASGAGSQGFLPPFQTKQVNGVSVQYALSPFGAGVYLGNTDSHILLTSSEPLMTELIAIQKGGKGGALDDLTKESKEILSNPLGVAALQIDYSSVAQLIEGLSASLGIFTGGQPLMESKELEALRGLGKTAVQLVFKDNAIRFISRSEAAKV